MTNSKKLPASNWHDLRFTLPAAILLGLGLGTLGRATLAPLFLSLGELSLFIIQVLKTLATPLIFFATLEGVLQTDLTWTQARRLLVICGTNALVASVLTITLVTLAPLGSFDLEVVRSALRDPATSTSAPMPQPPQVSFVGILESLFPKSLLEPFSTNQIVGAVVLALLFGFALKKVRRQPQHESAVNSLEKFFSAALATVQTVLGWVIKVIPLAVFGIIAKLVSQYGLAPFVSLILFAGIVIFGLGLQSLVYYQLTLWIFAKRSPLQHLKTANPALLTALGTGSSLATLPVTLDILENQMGVSKKSSRLAAVIGTNLNQDGIFIYEVTIALLLARILGVDLSWDQMAIVLGVSAVAAFGIGGIPDAGLITLSLVLSTVSLPLAAVPFLLPIDWLIGRLRAATNVLSDLTVACLLDAWEIRGRKSRA